jgi:RNA polymerase sigma factor (sigma-70 family)
MPERDPSSDLSLELVRRIQAGDRGAWDRLYRRYHDGLLFAVRSRLGPGLRGRLESEDILQSVVKDALRDLERFEPRGPGSLQHYLHACVLNKIRVKAAHHAAQKRDAGREVGGEAVDELPDRLDAPQYFDAPRYERLERAVATLPEAMREAVLLRTVEGLDNEAAAEVLKRTPAAASKLYNRALARLGASLGADEDAR